ncbi:hypothetical protein GN244_ATG09461 [Phytophthora infestans]|uniref:Uncharacterized protein n=1 Tax=Phytophthora infestans TaxID=4787 RepID=A0A833W1G6_PHYIN|nr:hypothetical protein GN244_ATG09461 [Phytophthora infestans]
MVELERVESAMEDYKKWSANALRAECRRLRTALASSNKSSYLDALRASRLVTESYTVSGVVQSPFRRSKPKRNTVACVLRFLNVLFSGSFCDGVARLGDLAKWQDPDIHTTGSPPTGGVK